MAYMDEECRTRLLTGPAGPIRGEFAARTTWPRSADGACLSRGISEYPPPISGVCPPYPTGYIATYIPRGYPRLVSPSLRKIFLGAIFSRRIRVCSAGDASTNVRAPHRHLRRTNRARVVRLALGVWDTRRTARRCDRRPFGRYSSRENSTGWQAEEGGDDTNRLAPEVSAASRGRALWAGKAGYADHVLGRGGSRLPVRHGGAGLEPGDVPATAHPAQSVREVAREARPPQGEPAGRDRDPEAGEAPAEGLVVVSGRTGGGGGVEGPESRDPRRARLRRAQTRGGREVECG